MFIKLERFGGLVPRYIPSLINDTQASLAYNVNLKGSILEPFREPKEVEVTDIDCIRTLHRLPNCCFLSFKEDCVSIARWLPTCERVYITGLKEYPVVASVGVSCNLEYKRVGLPRPEPLKVTYSENTPKEQTSVLRSYVYTYVDSFGGEGQPSEATEVTLVDPKTIGHIDFPTPPSGWDIDGINLYRLTQEFNEGSQEGYSEYHLVARLNLVFDFDDDVSEDELTETLSSTQYAPPPDGLENITALPNGVLFGSVGNEIWFTAPYEPQAWLKKYTLVLDDEVRGLKYSNGNIYALTDGHPYVIGLEVDKNNQRSVLRIPYPAPIISIKSLVEVPNGVIYATTSGLVNVSQSRVSVLTSPWFSKDDWASIHPNTLAGAIVEGKYLGSTDRLSFLFDLRLNAENDGIDNNDFMPITLSFNALYASDSGELYVAMGNVIGQWDAGVNYLKFMWKSKDLELGSDVCLSGAKVNLVDYSYPLKASDSLEVSLEGDDRVIFQRDINNSKAFRLPSNRRYQKINIKISGKLRVKSLEIGASFKELR